jgi:hypothetical protein
MLRTRPILPGVDDRVPSWCYGWTVTGPTLSSAVPTASVDQHAESDFSAVLLRYFVTPRFLTASDPVVQSTRLVGGDTRPGGRIVAPEILPGPGRL